MNLDQPAPNNDDKAYSSSNGKQPAIDTHLEEGELDEAGASELENDHSTLENTDTNVANYGNRNGDLLGFDEETERLLAGQKALLQQKLQSEFIGPEPPPPVQRKSTTNPAPPANLTVPAPSNTQTQRQTQPSPPPHPADTSADQTLENLKMAYYWAGYYSGLYDAQRQPQSQSQDQPMHTSYADEGSGTRGRERGG